MDERHIPTAGRTAASAPADRGAVLVLVLLMTVVLGVVVVAVATYVGTGLRFGNVVEERADRLAAADGGLRYGIERLQLSSYAACTSGIGVNGHTIEFPENLNGAEVDVTCSKVAGDIADVQGWALVITGKGVPAGQPFLTTQSGAGHQKLLGGPIWLSDPPRIDIKAPVTIENGDIWYHGTDCNGPAPVIPSSLTFSPEFRGAICVPDEWSTAFTEPPVNVPTSPPAALNPPPDTTTYASCSVFSPGVYTTAPTLTSQNYFRSGEYYFENVAWSVKQATVVAGWADQEQFGDQQFLPVPACADAIAADRASGSQPGATFYLGGSSRIDISTQGALEIQRRRQGAGVVSIHALDASGPGYLASTLGWNDDVIATKAGNTSDLVLHGNVWAPRAAITFGTVANRANGQLLGGAVLARTHLQSSNADSFVIRVEPSPAVYRLRVRATATKNERSTSIVAIVEVDDVGTTAVNSWRVVG